MRNLKRVLALALALVMVIGMMVMGASAASTTEYDYEEAQAIVIGTEIFEGDETGAMDWEGTLTREMAAKIMAYIMLGKKTADKLVAHTQNFTDVATNRWSAGYIEYCVDTGLIAGNGAGGFDPEVELTALAFAKLLLVAQGYDADVEGYVGANWSTAIAVDAMAEGLDLEEITLYDTINRQQAAQMILQMAGNTLVEYERSFDKATGAEILTGPEEIDNCTDDDHCKNHSFGAKYLDLVYTGRGNSTTNWGRPYDHSWKLKNATLALYTAWETPVLTYTEAVSECDIAHDLGLNSDGTIAKAFLNNVSINTASDDVLDNSLIERLDTRTKIGAQGRLVEVYKFGKGANAKYDIVMIDTFLAKVTDVEGYEYDKNGHIEAYPVLDLLVYDGTVNNDTGKGGTSVSVYSLTEWDYKKGDMVLVYAQTEDVDPEDDAVVDDEGLIEVVGLAESIDGAQSAIIYNASAHEVEEEEYPDAYQFHKDEAGVSTADHTWYFDSYGNLIGAFDIATVYGYGVVSAIKWVERDDNLEDGYALATITYMDGTTSNEKIYRAPFGSGMNRYYDDFVTSYDVEETKQNNEYLCNQALYQIETTKYGLVLTEVAVAENAKLANGEPELTTSLDAGKSTMFLVWDSYYEVYETYTGIKNIPDYEGEYDIWYVDVKNDGVADYVFVCDPYTEYTTTDVLYYHDGNVSVREVLYSGGVYYYVISGGYVNGEKASIAVYTEAAKDKIVTDCKGTLVVLSQVEGMVYYTDDVNPVTDHATSVKVSGKTIYAVYGGAATDASLVDDILITAGGSYDVESYTLIGSRDELKDILDEATVANNSYIYVVYTKGGTAKDAAFIYVSKVAGSAYVAPSEVTWADLATALVKAYDDGTATKADLVAMKADVDAIIAATDSISEKADAETASTTLGNKITAIESADTALATAIAGADAKLDTYYDTLTPANSKVDAAKAAWEAGVKAIAAAKSADEAKSALGAACLALDEIAEDEDSQATVLENDAGLTAAEAVAVMVAYGEDAATIRNDVYTVYSAGSAVVVPALYAAGMSTADILKGYVGDENATKIKIAKAVIAENATIELYEGHGASVYSVAVVLEDILTAAGLPEITVAVTASGNAYAVQVGIYANGTWTVALENAGNVSIAE